MSWRAHVWKGEGVDKGFQDKAVDTLRNTLADQVSHNINAYDKGDAPSWVIYCDDAVETMSTFKWWLEHNKLVDEGQHHMLIVDCVNTNFTSRANGDMTHNPDGTNDYAASVVNAATALLGKNRFKSTVIHEFGHTGLDESYCPYAGTSQPVREHSCGGVVGDFWTSQYFKTPMIIANEGNIPDDKECVHDGPCCDGFVTGITSCTKKGMEAYHNNN